MNHEFFKGTFRSNKQEACMYRTDVDLNKSRGLSGFNVRIQQLFEYKWPQDQLIEHDENEISRYKNMKFKFKINSINEISIGTPNPFHGKPMLMNFKTYNQETDYLRAVHISSSGELIFAGEPPKMIGTLVGLTMVFSFTADCTKF